jgi:hypothetical protein
MNLEGPSNSSNRADQLSLHSLDPRTGGSTDEKSNAFCGLDRPPLGTLIDISLVNYTRRVSRRTVQCLSRSDIAQA